MCDFWRAVPTGRFFIIRGFDEDSSERVEPGVIFDAILPIWRVGEALLHAAGMAKEMKRNENSEVNIKFRVMYSGLAGRVLRSWAGPLNNFMIEGKAATSNEAVLEILAPAADVDKNLSHYLYPFISSLYERFGVSGLSEDFVRSEVSRLQHSRA